jgi:hypothetical protein
MNTSYAVSTSAPPIIAEYFEWQEREDKITIHPFNDELDPEYILSY